MAVGPASPTIIKAQSRGIPCGSCGDLLPGKRCRRGTSNCSPGSVYCGILVFEQHIDAPSSMLCHAEAINRDGRLSWKFLRFLLVVARHFG
jgi:hypothetical protein